jgi:hypothetical protein
MNQCANTSYLREYENEEVRKDHRAERVKERAAGMLLEGGECHPWTIDNFREALGHCADADLMIALAYVRSAILGCKLENKYANQSAMVELKNLVEKYWHGVAEVIADREED